MGTENVCRLPRPSSQQNAILPSADNVGGFQFTPHFCLCETQSDPIKFFKNGLDVDVLSSNIPTCPPELQLCQESTWLCDDDPQGVCTINKKTMKDDLLHKSDLEDFMKECGWLKTDSRFMPEQSVFPEIKKADYENIDGAVDDFKKQLESDCNTLIELRKELSKLYDEFLDQPKVDHADLVSIRYWALGKFLMSEKTKAENSVTHYDRIDLT